MARRTAWSCLCLSPANACRTVSQKNIAAITDLRKIKRKFSLSRGRVGAEGCRFAEMTYRRAAPDFGPRFEERPEIRGGASTLCHRRGQEGFRAMWRVFAFGRIRIPKADAAPYAKVCDRSYSISPNYSPQRTRRYAEELIKKGLRRYSYPSLNAQVEQLTKCSLFSSANLRVLRGENEFSSVKATVHYRISMIVNECG